MFGGRRAKFAYLVGHITNPVIISSSKPGKGRCVEKGYTSKNGYSKKITNFIRCILHL